MGCTEYQPNHVGHGGVAAGGELFDRQRLVLLLLLTTTSGDGVLLPALLVPPEEERARWERRLGVGLGLKLPPPVLLRRFLRASRDSSSGGMWNLKGDQLN
jgi:hypothetical protein